MVKPLHVLWNCHQILEQLTQFIQVWSIRFVYPYTDSKVTILSHNFNKNEFLE